MVTWLKTAWALAGHSPVHSVMPSSQLIMCLGPPHTWNVRTRPVLSASLIRLKYARSEVALNVRRGLPARDGSRSTRASVDRPPQQRFAHVECFPRVDEAVSARAQRLGIDYIAVTRRASPVALGDVPSRRCDALMRCHLHRETVRFDRVVFPTPHTADKVRVAVCAYGEECRSADVSV